MATARTNSTLLPMSAVIVALALAVSACNSSSTKPQQSSPTSPSASTSSSEAGSPSPSTTATSAQAAGTIVLEVTGSGDVYAIWAEPFGSLASDHATLPFSKSFPLPADVNYVALNWTPRDDNPKGCKITVDNKVVVEHAPAAGVDPCVFQR
jgi:hypothetical protein